MDYTMTELLGVSASARKWGNCEASVKSVLVAAREAGARTDFIRLTDFSIGACRGCFKCLGPGKRCPVDDDLYRVLGEFSQAGGVVMATPVYFLSPPAALTGLLDRLLTMGSREGRGIGGRPAVTMTVMGNRAWRGVAEPLVNMTVSLLGFDVLESMSLVAEGPGEILSQQDTARRFTELGRRLALGETIESRVRGEVCPVCWSDFFRIESGKVTCPVCGAAGDLDAYLKSGGSAVAADGARWGLAWLDRHIQAWVAPSVVRYKTKLRSVFENLRLLKDRYSTQDERGDADV
jgi:multimeric flavodoxin WrbA